MSTSRSMVVGRVALLMVVTLLVVALPAAAQDTLRLGALQEAAMRHDARAQQLVLQLEAHELRLRNLGVERLPQFMLRGEATHQSDVPTLPLAPAPGLDGAAAPRTRYQIAAAAEQQLYDGGLLRRREDVERARHAELDAELAATLYALTHEVVEAYFAALLLQQRDAEIRLLVEDLDARQAQIRSAVRAGTALPGDTAAVLAERLRAQQQITEVAADRTAAVANLARLTGRRIEAEDVLVLPDLARDVARVQAAGGAAAVRERPEFERLALLRTRLSREADVVVARTRPQLIAFGQAGLGRPGPFQLFDDAMNEYWSVGLRLQWQPWTWGRNARERTLLGIQQQVAETEASALAERLAREVERDVQAMERLAAALALDEQIITLREQVERQARSQFAERTLTASQYLSIRNDVYDARVAWQRHRVELERARARYLTTLGVKVNS